MSSSIGILQKKGKRVGYMQGTFLFTIFVCFFPFFRNMKVILHFPPFRKYEFFLLLLFCIYLCTFRALKTDLKCVAYNRDKLLFSMYMYDSRLYFSTIFISVPNTASCSFKDPKFIVRALISNYKWTHGGQPRGFKWGPEPHQFRGVSGSDPHQTDLQCGLKSAWSSGCLSQY